ncbi:MAG: UDP-glucuronic acid decarboxylase family protein [Patescibacteria group bacterium]
MKVLITGCAGFIGSNFVSHLLSESHEVYGIDNLLTGSMQNIDDLRENKRFTFYQEDVLSFDFSYLPSCDIIYHLASPASPIQYKKHPVETLMVNSLGTKRVLDYMVNSKSKRLVISSTSEVYGDPHEHPQNEAYWGNVNPVGVRSCYDEGKRFSEAMAMTYYRKYGQDVRIARIFNTYGPNMEKEDGRVVSNFIMQALLQKPVTIYGTGKQTRSFCYISDMIDGLYKLGTTDNIKGEIVNLGNTDEKTILELAQIIINLTSSSSQIIFRPIDGDDPKKRKPEITKAMRLLGWRTNIPLEEGLRKTIDYFKKRFI